MNKYLKLSLILGLLIAVIAFAGGCYMSGAEGEEASTMDMLYPIIFLVVIFGLFYFVMVRPQRKRQKQHQAMMQELQKGDRVITAGGIYGTIDGVSEDSFVLKIESGTTIRIARSSVVARRDAQ